jgi:UDP-glucose 4-epimerase
MKILITGGCGFIGSNIANALNKYGYEVHIIDDLSSSLYNNYNNLISLGIKIYVKKIHDYFFLDRLFHRIKFDLVIHLAAKKNIYESMERPAYYYYENYIGTKILIEAMINSKLSNIIFSSTAAVYCNQSAPVTEKSKTHFNNAYAKSKLLCEDLIRLNEKKFKNAFILRYFNPAGCSEDYKFGEDSSMSDNLFSNIIKSLKTNGEFIIYGNSYNTKDGTCIRDIININSLVNIHKVLVNNLNNKNNFEIFNIGTNHGVSVKEVVDSIKKIIGKNFNYKIGKERNNEVAFSVANSEKYINKFKDTIGSDIDKTCFQVLRFNGII